MHDLLMEEKLVIWGCGDVGSNLLRRLLEQNADNIGCFCDNNPGKQGETLMGHKILPPQEAVKKYPNALFVITAYNHTDAIKEQLLKMKIAEEKILVFTPNDYINETDRECQKKREKEYDDWCREHTGRVKFFRNKYLGKRCFIIGNGGSLTAADLEKLSDEYTFGCNRLYKMFPELNWRPNFYCFYDKQRVELIKKDLSYILDNCDFLFTTTNIKEQLQSGETFHEKLFFVKMKKEKYYPHLPKFSDDASKEIYDGQTVLYMATQLAVYMGFREIYYIGADNHYSIELNMDGTIKRSEVKDYPNALGKLELKNSVVPQIELTTMAFEAAKEYAKRNNIHIYNSTRGGKLEVFERKNLDEVLRQEQV